MSHHPPQVVLVGAGQAHLFLATQTALLARLGAEVTLVAPRPYRYAPLASSILAGQLAPGSDLVPIEAHPGAGGLRCIDASVRLIRPADRVVELNSGQSLSYDLLSLDIGGVVDHDGIRGAREWGWRSRPRGGLIHLRGALERWMHGTRRPLPITIVGGGPAGCEIAACLAELTRRADGLAEIRLVTQSPRLVERWPERAARLLADALVARRVHIETGVAVRALERDAVVLANGRRVDSHVSVLANGLLASPLAAAAGLPVGPTGAVRTTPTLAVPGFPGIFAAGECACIESLPPSPHAPCATRQATVLLANLSAALGSGEPIPYVPPARSITLLNLGEGEAFALRGDAPRRDAYCLRLKRRLDRLQIHRLRPET